MISKLKRKEDLAKKKRRNQIWVGIILVGLMLLSTVGFSLMNYDSSTSGSGNGILNGAQERDKGLDFVVQNGQWTLELSGRLLVFNNLPSAVQDIPIEGTIQLGSFAQNPTYLVDTDQGLGQLIYNIDPYLFRYQEACLEGRDCLDETLPIKTCQDYIFISEPSEEETKVVIDQNCIYLRGETLKAADALTYRLYGIN